MSDSRIRSIIAKGPKYRFSVQKDFQKCREKIAGSLNEFCDRWCKREHVECDALKGWKLNIFKIIDRRISFYSQNTNMLPRKPKIRYLKSGIEEFHRKYVLVPADEAANNYIDTLKQELSGTKVYEQTSEKEKSRKENPQKLTQLSSRSHPRHLVGKRTAQKDITIETTSDSQVNSNFPNRCSPASLTFNNYLTYFYIYI